MKPHKFPLSDKKQTVLLGWIIGADYEDCTKQINVTYVGKTNNLQIYILWCVYLSVKFKILSGEWVIAQGVFSVQCQ